ncbi:MAG: hypothetical protein WBM50_03930, partial [Acidimicrobiales bacterium]
MDPEKPVEQADDESTIESLLGGAVRTGSSFDPTRLGAILGRTRFGFRAGRVDHTAPAPAVPADDQEARPGDSADLDAGSDQSDDAVDAGPVLRAEGDAKRHPGPPPT